MFRIGTFLIENNELLLTYTPIDKVRKNQLFGTKGNFPWRDFSKQPFSEISSLINFTPANILVKYSKSADKYNLRKATF